MKTCSGNRLAAALESVPEETSSPHLPFTTPLSLKSIEVGRLNGMWRTSDRYPTSLVPAQEATLMGKNSIWAWHVFF